MHQLKYTHSHSLRMRESWGWAISWPGDQEMSSQCTTEYMDGVCALCSQKHFSILPISSSSSSSSFSPSSSSSSFFSSSSSYHIIVPLFYPRNAITVGIFYGLPALQFVLGQQLVRLYQWRMLCYVSCLSTLSTDSVSHWLPGIVLLQLWVCSPMGSGQVTVMWPLVSVKWCIFYFLHVLHAVLSTIFGATLGT